MDIIWEYLQDLEGSGSTYAIAALLIIVWWVGRSFARLYHQAADGPGRIKKTDDEERPRRRLPLQ